MTQSIRCEFCHTPVPLGATVCTGCHAELDYGVPDWVFWTNVAVAILVSALVSLVTKSQALYAGAGVLYYVVAHVACARAFRHHVTFKRRR